MRGVPGSATRDRATVMAPDAQPVMIELAGAAPVSGLLQATRDARAGLVLAHGAGAGMTHSFMAAVAGGLAERGIAVLRYQFPYMERGSKRPDAPRVAHAAVRAAVAEAGRRLPGLPLFAGGKSFAMDVDDGRFDALDGGDDRGLARTGARQRRPRHERVRR